MIDCNLRSCLLLISKTTNLCIVVMIVLMSFDARQSFISRISENGPAGKDGILHVGDKILKVIETYYLVSLCYLTTIGVRTFPGKSAVEKQFYQNIFIRLYYGALYTRLVNVQFLVLFKLCTV